MKLYALLALCVLHAHAATISSPEKKLDDISDIELDNAVSEPELVDQTHEVKDVDNNLRNNLVDVPVKIIVENVKINENSNDYVPNNDDSINLKRAPVNLKNTGLPQRQEHETQNPEHYTDRQKVIFTLKQSIEDTQKKFNNGLKSLSNNFKNLFENKEKLSTVQENLEKLKITFGDEVSKLNDTIQSYIAPEVDDKDKYLENVKSRINLLQNNVESGVGKLSEGVELLAIIKEEDDAIAAKADGDVAEAAGEVQPSQPAVTPAAPEASNFVTQFIANFQQGLTGSFTSLSNAVQNYFGQNQQANQNQPPQGAQADTPQASNQGGNFVTNLFQGISLPSLPTLPPFPFFGQQNQAQAQNKPPGVAADEPVQTGWRPPNFVQQIQNTIGNFVNSGQNQQQTQAPQPQPQQQQQQQPPQFSGGPIAQTIQSIVYAINNRPNNSPSPVAAAPEKPAESNVQEKPAEVAGTNSVPSEPASSEPAKQTGPIQQIVQNNPIVKGIQTAVHRLRNPDRPRDEVKPDVSKGYGGNGNGNIADSSGIKSVEAEVEKIDEPISGDIVAEQIQPIAEPAKTE